MKWVTAGVTFVNLSVVCGLLLGLAGRGLNTVSAALALVCGAAFGIASFLGTRDSAVRQKSANGLTAEQKPRKSSGSEDTPNAIPSALMRYRRVWFWAVAICFAVFAVRSFCWLLYIDSSELKIQSPNNLGDLSLHLTLIKNFANGVVLWPDNPIFVFSKLRYPAGVDLFNALLSLVHIDLLIGLVWVGLLASLAIFYGFYRWGGTFAVAGFLFNGGIAGFQFLKTFKFLDYQGAAADIAHKPIAWKSIALSMLVTQRGWLYAIPAGLVLLWHWREKFFSQPPVAGVGSSAVALAKADDPGQSDDTVKSEPAAVNAQGYRKGPLPWWVELSIYASMPLFHLHTFIALTIVLVVGLFFERATELKFVANLVRNEGMAGIGRLISHPKVWPDIFRGAPIRRHAAAMLIAAFIPATFFVWLTTDQFRASSVLKWHPGWAQDSTEFAAPFFKLGPKDFGSSTAFGLLLQKTWNGVIAPIFQFWLPNFGLWVPLASRLGSGFDRIRRAFFQTRPKGFWGFLAFRFARAKNMERRHRSVFPILAAQLRFMGAVGIGACWFVRLAYLEGQVALGRQATSGYRFRGRGSRDFRFRLFRSNRPVGVGQSQAHGVGLFSYSAFSVERHHWALGFPGAGGNMSAALRFRIYHAARRPVCRTPGLWIN